MKRPLAWDLLQGVLGDPSQLSRMESREWRRVLGLLFTGEGSPGQGLPGRSGEGGAKARSSRRSRTLEAQRREENEQKVVGAYIRKDGKEQSVLEPEHGEQEQSRFV